MPLRRRTGLILGIACALLVVVILLARLLLNADLYRPKVISYLEGKIGKKVAIGRLAVKFSSGVTIQVDDFGVKSPPLFPPSYVVKVARIDAQLDVGALLHRAVELRESGDEKCTEHVSIRSGVASGNKAGAGDRVKSSAFRCGWADLFRGARRL
jgi:hypothetical protein